MTDDPNDVVAGAAKGGKVKFTDFIVLGLCVFVVGLEIENHILRESLGQVRGDIYTLQQRNLGLKIEKCAPAGQEIYAGPNQWVKRSGDFICIYEMGAQP